MSNSTRSGAPQPKRRGCRECCVIGGYARGVGSPTRLRTLLAMTQRRFASELVHYSIVKQPACFVARMSAAKSGALRENRIPLRFIRATDRTRVIAPCLVRPQGLPVILFLISPVGACGTTGRFTAPAAPACVWHAGSPHAAFAAHGQWPSPTPKIVELNRASEADLRLRSARGWTLRLAASLTGNCRLRRPRPDRASCRAGMHLDRPPVASASISCPTANPRLSSVIRSIQARHRSGHRIPLPRFDDDRDAPLTGAGCDRRYKSYREDQEQKANKRQLFFLRIRKALSAATTPKVALAWLNLN